MIANINKVHDRLWTGGDLDPRSDVANRQASEIQQIGISDVLDLRIEWDDAEFYEDLDVDYHWLGVDDDGRGPNDNWWHGTLVLCRNILSVKGTVLLTHCHMGINRGPSLAAALLVDRFGYEPLEAWECVREARPMSYAIYLPGALKHLGLDPVPVQKAIRRADRGGAVRRTIGAVRTLQDTGQVVHQEAVTSTLQENP